MDLKRVFTFSSYAFNMNYNSNIRQSFKETNLLCWENRLDLLQTLISWWKSHSLEKNNFFINGIHLPTNPNFLNGILLHSDMILHTYPNPDVDLIICDKYPDWDLIEQARSFNAEIIYIDAAGIFFNIKAANLEKKIFPTSLGHAMKF